MPDSLSLLISVSWVTYLLFAVLLLFLAFFYYRVTIPVVSKLKKYFLGVLRLLILLLLLMLLFDPVLNLTFKSKEVPENYFFIDRSASINFSDGTKREETVKKFISDLFASPLGSVAKVFSFSGDIDTATLTPEKKIPSFDGKLTNFESIFNFIKKNSTGNATITIVSDGVITDGNDPLLLSEKVGFPVFTVAIGDSSAKKDISVDNVAYNEFVIRGSKTPIAPTVSVYGFPESEIGLSLSENGKVIAKKTVSVEKNGTTSVIFDYQPATVGIKKLTVKAEEFPEEINVANNGFPFFINVIDNRKKVLVLSGAPTPDVSFVKNALEGDSSLTVRSMTFDSSPQPLEKDINNSVFDSTGVLFLLNFPSNAVPTDVFNTVLKLISERNVPFFILINQYSSLSGLKKIEPYLPVTIQTGAGTDYEAQPGIAQGIEKDPLFYANTQSDLKDWDNLSPVFVPNLRGVVRPESKVIAWVKINSRVLSDPMIISRNFGNKRSLAIIASDIWKWKLKAKNANLFDDFLFSTAKWLGAVRDKKRFSVRTNKQFYSRNEEVEFIAEVYNESFDPVSDAEVRLNLKTPSGNNSFTLTPTGAGVYIGSYQPQNSGDHSYFATASLDSKPIGTDNGVFNVGDVDIEMVDPYTNASFLRTLCSITNGSFYTGQNYSDLFKELEKYNEKAAKEFKESRSKNLWVNPWLLGFLILLLSTEWFLRKREGMQ
ncbi:MAG: hypothetical protein LC102_02365 [Ignavibacteriales bacterium]|nr:MAG: VWA domain-containing protein [Ignavibacteriaceae bacterium]MBW7872159.1 hypothetical protein [Ignavibacteria bacterium]MCZ2142257.1 hypothetical protein [Ignavibacteriales bacterium]OQY78803.1 MAG: hypothetical protein B6D45_01805 [Ignavibacteriales bacterium UTCHB3]MBV6445696.1 hypothetical protein [Ignavibacteriaceae bacterium]